MNPVHPIRADHTSTKGPQHPAEDLEAQIRGIRASMTDHPLTRTRGVRPARAGGVVCYDDQQDITSYVPGPQHVCTQEQWAEIGAFVRDAVRKAPPTTPLGALGRMSNTTSFVRWCLLADVPLTVESIFTPTRVEAYTAELTRSGRSPRAVSSVRSTLRTVGIACTKKAPWPRPPAQLRRGGYVNAPYSAEDISQFWEACLAQPTRHRRHVMATILALGLGCGLSSYELYFLETSHIIEHPNTRGCGSSCCRTASCRSGTP